MGQVVNTLDPVPTGRVYARVMAASGWYATTTGPAEAVATWSADINTDGTWALELPASSSYDEPDTWYRIDEPGASHACVVPDGAGPFELHDIEIEDPAGPACCPPPPASSVALAARVDALEAEVDVHEVRLDAVEAHDVVQDARITALESSAAGANGYRHTQSVPVQLVQILHGLPFRPAGVICVDPLDDITEFERIEHTAPGVTEITFGASFTGVIDLS